MRGRVAHESLFNVANGTYRGPSTQQGYSPFSTWTRGLAWAMLGFAEQLEFLATLTADASRATSGAPPSEPALVDAARATCDFYIDVAACADGVPYWDTGAPGLSALGDWGAAPSDPFNDREPVDSSAAAIARAGAAAVRPRSLRSGAARTADPLRRRRACACSTRCSTTAART